MNLSVKHREGTIVFIDLVFFQSTCAISPKLLLGFLWLKQPITISEVGRTYITHPERLRKVEELKLRQGCVKELQGSRLNPIIQAESKCCPIMTNCQLLSRVEELLNEHLPLLHCGDGSRGTRLPRRSLSAACPSTHSFHTHPQGFLHATSLSRGSTSADPILQNAPSKHFIKEDELW